MKSLKMMMIPINTDVYMQDVVDHSVGLAHNISRLRKEHKEKQGGHEFQDSTGLQSRYSTNCLEIVNTCEYCVAHLLDLSRDINIKGQSPRLTCCLYLG